MKKRRAERGYLRPNIDQIASSNIRHVKRLQRFGRKIYWKQGLVWRKYLKNGKHGLLEALYLKKFHNKLTRDKETYWLQRYSLGRIETEQIIKYQKQMEKKFEINWK